jgi:late competence protein required for DNA uptake (superfamily II DNA/RNA helicase)
MSSLGLLTIVFYRTLQDYDNSRPARIFIIAPRRDKKLALEKARRLERWFPDVDIDILYEGKDKEAIDRILDLCLNSNKVLSPSPW